MPPRLVEGGNLYNTWTVRVRFPLSSFDCLISYT